MPWQNNLTSKLVIAFGDDREVGANSNKQLREKDFSSPIKWLEPLLKQVLQKSASSST